MKTDTSVTKNLMIGFALLSRASCGAFEIARILLLALSYTQSPGVVPYGLRQELPKVAGGMFLYYGDHGCDNGSSHVRGRCTYNYEQRGVNFGTFADDEHLFEIGL